MFRRVSNVACTAVLLACCGGFAAQAAETSGGLNQALLDIEKRFDELAFATSDDHERRDGFEQLVDMAAAVVDANPGSAEALTWQGIVLSSYAGEVSAFSAMKYAKAAREALHKAESLDAQALSGSVYTSLGALYSHVPGGFVGFGDDDLALEYLRKAVAISPNDLDANFFLGELLIDQEMFDEAEQVLVSALASPPVTSRPLLDDARREQMRSLLADVNAHRS
jgi:tetratricopeptide (TPR) repeat protein